MNWWDVRVEIKRLDPETKEKTRMLFEFSVEAGNREWAYIKGISQVKSWIRDEYHDKFLEEFNSDDGYVKIYVNRYLMGADDRKRMSLA